MKDQEFINRITKMVDRKRQENPLQKQINKLTEDIYPYSKLLEIFYLGEANMLKAIKDSLSIYMCKDDVKLLDSFIEEISNGKYNCETVGKYLKELMKN